MKNLVLLLFFILSVPAAPVWAQKNLVPAGRALLTNAPKTAARACGSASSFGATTAARALTRFPAAQAVPPASRLKFQHSLQRRALFQVDKTRQAKNDELLRQIDQTWEQNEDLIYGGAYETLYTPLQENTPFAYQNNQIVLAASKSLLQKTQWLKQRKGQGQAELGYVSSGNLIKQLAAQVEDSHIVFLGEFHYVPEIQRAVGQLLYALKDRNPGRRIVLFTEFIDLPPTAREGAPASLASYYRRASEFPTERIQGDDPHLFKRLDYARDLFEILLDDHFEIYPLEDRKLCSMIYQEEGLLRDMQVSALAITLRNKTWARMMEHKMAQIRKTDPDALFVVYAGMAHTSWIMPYALPKFFAKAKTSVVEFSVGEPSEINTLCGVWDREHPYFRKQALFYWQGREARLLGRQTGFDYALILP